MLGGVKACLRTLNFCTGFTRGWASRMGLIWTDPEFHEGNTMADDESLLTNPPTQDAAIHVRDYMRFTKLLTIGAFTCLVIGFFVLLIL